MVARRVCHLLALYFCLQLMPAQTRLHIAIMDIRLSISISPPPRVSLSPSPGPLPAEAPSPPTSMPLPPEATYSSREELYASIQAWAAKHHYAFRIERSTKIDNSIRTRILYSCDRAGPAPPANHPQHSLQDRKRRTATRKTGCQFSIVARERADTQWELRYRPGTEYSIHNHPPSQAISSHPAHRKLAQAEVNKARSLHSAGKSNNIFYLSKR
jgi:hypothetical protein